MKEEIFIRNQTELVIANIANHLENAGSCSSFLSPYQVPVLNVYATLHYTTSRTRATFPLNMYKADGHCQILYRFARHSPLQLVIRWRVLGCDIGQVSEDLGTVDGEAGEQDKLLPGGAQQAGVVFYGELTEERQLLDPGDLTEEQLICQATQQGKQLYLGHFVPGMNKRNKGLE